MIEMAAFDNEIHHSVFSNNNDNNIYTSCPHFFEEINSVLSHGSISLGRYVDDSSEWDKRSIFTHDRCQEELEKYKSPGLVAQKKAYFDDFYKTRVLKELPDDQQETNQYDQQQINQYDPSQEEKENSKIIGNGINTTVVAVKEDKPSNVTQVQVSESQGILKHKEPPCREVERSRCTDNNDATVKERVKVTPIIDEVKNSCDVASVSVPDPPPPEGYPRRVQGKSIASSKVKQTINKTIKHGNVLKDKGTVASVTANKAKVRSVTTKDAVTKSKPQKASVIKVNKSVPSMKESTPNAVRTISRRTTEPHSSIPRLSRLSKSGSLVVSSSSSSIRKNEAKPRLIRNKKETEVPVRITSARVTEPGPSASTSSIKKAEVKPSLKLEQSRTKLETRSPLPSRSYKSGSKNIPKTKSVSGPKRPIWR